MHRHCEQVEEMNVKQWEMGRWMRGKCLVQFVTAGRGAFPSLFKCVWLFCRHEVLAVFAFVKRVHSYPGGNKTHTPSIVQHLKYERLSSVIPVHIRILPGHQSVCCTVQSTTSHWSAAVPGLFNMQTQKQKREHEGRRAYSSRLCIKHRVK